VPTADDIEATFTNAVCSALSALITIVKEREPPANAVPVCISKLVGAYIASEPEFPFTVATPTGPHATDEGTVGPGDADAGGTPMAVTMTGTDQATPLTTLRRLNSPFSLSATFAFRTSDKLCPRCSLQLRPASSSLAAGYRRLSRLRLLFRTHIKIPTIHLQGWVKICCAGLHGVAHSMRSYGPDTAEKLVPPSSVTSWSDSLRAADAEQSSHRPTNWWGQATRLMPSPVDDLIRMGPAVPESPRVRRRIRFFCRHDSGAGECCGGSLLKSSLLAGSSQ
jgi:hypothetical protein